MRTLALLALAGCAPGHIEWASGDDLIRTALYVTQEDQNATHVALLLSNGEFECKIHDGTVPAENEDARASRCYAAFREDARHVLLHLWYPRGGNPAGVYSGNTTAVAAGPFPDDGSTRWSRAAYLGIEEVGNNSGDNLVQDDFTVSRVTAWGMPDPGIIDGEFHSELLGDGGSASIEEAEDGALTGEFSYPTARVSGDFEAQFCEPDDDSIFRHLLIVDQDDRISEGWNLPLDFTQSQDCRVGTAATGE